MCVTCCALCCVCFITRLFSHHARVLVCLRSLPPTQLLSEGLGHGHIRPFDTTPSKFFQALPIAVFSFQNHAVVFPVFSEMKVQTLPVFTTVSKWTFGVILALYGATA